MLDDTPTIHTLKSLAKMARERKPFACLTAYDATTARWLERAGVHLLLVGDTAAEVILGHHRTIHMPLELSLLLTAAVKRGAPRTVVMGDMPFLSYQASIDQAVTNAGRFLTEGLADIVKLEVDASFAELVAKITRAGIPVCGHIGSRPQRAAISSGYASSGRTQDEADDIVRDAVAMRHAGCSMLLVEAVPPHVAQQIMEKVDLPLIGIGAGNQCHGQVLVFHDLVGLTDQAPRFARRNANLGEAILAAGADWVARVAAGDIGGMTYAARDSSTMPSSSNR